MKDEDFENKLKDAFSQHIELSHSYQNMVRTTLREQKRKKSIKLKAIRTLATSCACVVLVTSFVYAKDISKWINYFFDNSKSIDTAIENGYIEEPDMEYISSNGTDARVENFLMDDYNLSFTLDIKFGDNVSVNEINRIRLQDIIITDEENRILYCEDRETFDTYCKEKNLNYEYREFNENYIDGSNNSYIKNKDENTNSIKYICNLQGNQYPKSKKIDVKFTKIGVYKQIDDKDNKTIMVGSWNLPLDVPEKFYNREEIVYTIKSCNYDDIYIDEFSVKNTGTTFAFHTKVEPIYNESDTEEVKRDKKNKMYQWYYKETLEGRDFIINEYIEEESGDKYYSATNDSENSKTNYLITGEFDHYQIFNLSKYNLTNKLRIRFTLNLPSETRDVIIELERRDK